MLIFFLIIVILKIIIKFVKHKNKIYETVN